MLLAPPALTVFVVLTSKVPSLSSASVSASMVIAPSVVVTLASRVISSSAFKVIEPDVAPAAIVPAAFEVILPSEFASITTLPVVPAETAALTAIFPLATILISDPPAVTPPVIVRPLLLVVSISLI